MPLLRATFDCEVLTPMFLSGVDQTQCEIRAASVRGALRFWYRALLGGQGVTDLRELKKCEAAVFGGSGDKDGQGSPVTLRVYSPDLTGKLGSQRDLPDWTTPDPDNPRFGSPTQYLWYTVKMNDRPWVPPKTTFRVVLQTVASGARQAEREERLRDAITAFWLLTHLGGVGTRWRRSAGSFSARPVELPDGVDLPTFTQGGSFDLPTVSRHLGKLIRNPSPKVPDFSVLNETSRVWLADFDREHWEDVVWDVGKTLRDFRLRLGLADGQNANPAPPGFLDDYTRMRDAVTYHHAPSGPVGRVGFGLPLTFSFQVAPQQWDRQTLTPEGSDRRASPLCIRVIRLPTGRFDAVLTHLGGRFLPTDVEAREARGRRRLLGTIPPPSHSIVPHYVQSIRTARQIFPSVS